MRTLSQLFAVAALFAIAAPAMAQETKQCPITTAMGKLPTMTYKVGDKDACCPVSAEAMAKESGEKITFVVAEKKFDDKNKAFTSLVETTEAFVNKFAEPCKCEVSGTTTIAGKTCECPVEAGNRAEIVKKAYASIKMSYKVGDKTCNCPVEAATLASKSDAKKEFVVNDECTECEMTARLKLAHAKYRAAVEALAKADAATTTAATSADK